MKHFLFLAFACLLMLGACKETGPAIDFGPKAADTSFMASPETPQQRTVVIEEFTGVSCPPCFQGHKVLKAIEEKYPNRVAIIGIQASGPPQAKPLDSGDSKHPGIWTRHDNRTQKGTDLSTQLYGGLSSIPQAAIDRTINSANSALLYDDRSMWTTVVDSRVNTTPPVNVTISSTYTDNKREAVIKVHVAYTQAVSKTQLLNVALIESNVIDAQEGGDTVNYTQNYVHMHVLRDILTQTVGSTILAGMATKQPGLVYERTFIYSVDPSWNPDNCQVVAYISNNEGADKEVLQAAEAHLK